MSEHVDRLIDAYMDGELVSQQKQLVDEHLRRCESCQTLLLQRQQLGALLQITLPISGLKPAAVFTAEVLQSLEPVSSPQPSWRQELHGWMVGQRIARWGWLAVPFILLLATAFTQAVGILSSVLKLLPGSKPILVQAFTALQPSVGLEFTQPWGGFLSAMVGFDLSGWSLWTGFLVSTAIGLLYLAWIAGWLASRQAVEAYNLHFSSQRKI
jgi:hypothetical protein